MKSSESTDDLDEETDEEISEVCGESLAIAEVTAYNEDRMGFRCYSCSV